MQRRRHRCMRLDFLALQVIVCARRAGKAGASSGEAPMLRRMSANNKFRQNLFCPSSQTSGTSDGACSSVCAKGNAKTERRGDAALRCACLGARPWAQTVSLHHHLQQGVLGRPLMDGPFYICLTRFNCTPSLAGFGAGGRCFLHEVLIRSAVSNTKMPIGVPAGSGHRSGEIEGRRRGQVSGQSSQKGRD